MFKRGNIVHIKSYSKTEEFEVGDDKYLLAHVSDQSFNLINIRTGNRWSSEAVEVDEDFVNRVMEQGIDEEELREMFNMNEETSTYQSLTYTISKG